MILSEYGNLLVYQREYTLTDIQALIERHNLNGLEIRSLLSDEDFGDLSFLKDAIFLRELSIVSSFDYDFSFIPYLRNLHRLYLNAKGFANSELFANLPLKDLSLSMRRMKFDILVPPSLDTLYMDEVDASSLRFIFYPQNVKSFKIKSSKIRSLDGIENFVNLQSLSLGGISGLKELGQKLPLTLKEISLNQLRSLTALNVPTALADCKITVKHCKKLTAN